MRAWRGGGLTAGRSGATGGRAVAALGSVPAGKQVTQQQRSSRGDANRKSEISTMSRQEAPMSSWQKKRRERKLLALNGTGRLQTCLALLAVIYWPRQLIRQARRR